MKALLLDLIEDLVLFSLKKRKQLQHGDKKDTKKEPMNE